MSVVVEVDSSFEGELGNGGWRSVREPRRDTTTRGGGTLRLIRYPDPTGEGQQAAGPELSVLGRSDGCLRFAVDLAMSGLRFTVSRVQQNFEARGSSRVVGLARGRARDTESRERRLSPRA